MKILHSTLVFLAAVVALCAKQPNVLFIAVDDLKPDLGCYGMPVHSPTFDSLASQGTLFLNAHCQQAVCGPSRASLLTGRRPDYTQVWDLNTMIRDRRPDIVTIPQLFRENGYETAGTGKIFDPRSVDKAQDERSWSQKYKMTWHLKYAEGYGKPAGHYQSPEILKVTDEAEARGIKGWKKTQDFFKANNAWPSVEMADVPDNAYDDGAIGNQGVKFIKQLANQEKPFFIAVGFKKPHLPFVAPKKYWDIYDRDAIQLAPFQDQAEGSPDYAYHTFSELRNYSDIPAEGPLSEAQQRELIHGYYACISYIDAQIAKLIKALEKEGVADNTVIVLWGDHGWHLGDHGLWCKHTNYEHATRAPLMIIAPGMPAGQRTGTPTEFTDIFPTLIELCGLQNAPELDGVSLVPVLQDEAAEVRPFAISQYPRGPRMGYTMRTQRFRYVAWYKAPEGTIPSANDKPIAEELFDYRTDPLERINLTTDPQYAPAVEAFAVQMQQFLSEQSL